MRQNSEWNQDRTAALHLRVNLARRCCAAPPSSRSVGPSDSLKPLVSYSDLQVLV